MKSIVLFAAALLLCCTSAAWAQQQTSGTRPEKKGVKTEPIKGAVPDSGKDLYVELCASCHGKAAKGDGPAAPVFKAPPTDLTLLSKQNNGRFPADHFASVLRFGAPTPAHGSSDMPVWGSVLATSPSLGSDPVKVQQRILALSNYVEYLQAK